MCGCVAWQAYSSSSESEGEENGEEDGGSDSDSEETAGLATWDFVEEIMAELIGPMVQGLLFDMKKEAEEARSHRRLQSWEEAKEATRLRRPRGSARTRRSSSDRGAPPSSASAASA